MRQLGAFWVESCTYYVTTPEHSPDNNLFEKMRERGRKGGRRGRERGRTTNNGAVFGIAQGQYAAPQLCSSPSSCLMRARAQLLAQFFSPTLAAFASTANFEGNECAAWNNLDSCIIHTDHVYDTDSNISRFNLKRLTVDPL